MNDAPSTRRDSADVRYLLVNPPWTDPTCPYHSISYLVGSARAAGFTGYTCLDANVDALNHLAEPRLVARTLARANRLRERIERQDVLTRTEELRYQVALSAADLTPDFARRAIDVFRDPVEFYHYPTYRQAVMAVYRWTRLLALEAPPGLFSRFELRVNGPVNYMSVTDLADESVIDSVSVPFQPYIEGPFADELRQRKWDVIGFSVNYLSQLPVALRMAREARSLCPDSVIVFGGTEVCDDVKYARDKNDVWRIFRDADLIVPGEGESAFCAILAAVRDGAPLRGLSGVMSRDDLGSAVPVRYENVGALPPPAYDIWDWGAYWSPEPVMLYSPARGCYWNKCTFCDYGLNTDRPTSPARERSVEQVLQDLGDITAIGKYVYFAVDAMSPKYLRTLAGAMAESPLEVRWCAELRLERTFPRRGMAELLARSGAVAISFGYESGSQRILDLIDKGVQIAEVESILTDLARHGIAAQMMGFTGFPTESGEEAAETYEFLKRHRELWSIAAIGNFMLTPGSIVAKVPERFGIELAPTPPNDDLVRFRSWREHSTGVVHRPDDPEESVAPEIANGLRLFADNRPFAGGIDTAHSMLYFGRNGRRMLPAEPSGEPLVRLVGESLRQVPFGNYSEFTSISDLEKEHADLHWGGGGVRHRAIRKWLDKPGQAKRGECPVLVLPHGLTVDLPAGVDMTPGSPMAQLVRILAEQSDTTR